MILGSVQAVVDKLATTLGASVPVHLGKRALPLRDKGASAYVVVVPTTTTLTLPTIKDYGADHPIVYTSKQQLEIHCWAKAPANLVTPARQYGDDLTQAETLRAKVAAALRKYVDGVAAGGSGPLVEAGENVHGVELVLTVTAEISVRDLPLTVATPDTTFECDCADDLTVLPAPPP